MSFPPVPKIYIYICIKRETERKRESDCAVGPAWQDRCCEQQLCMNETVAV